MRDWLVETSTARTRRGLLEIVHRWRPLAPPLAAALLLLAAGPPAPAADTAASLEAALRSALAAPAESCPGAGLDGRALARFYPAEASVPLWIDGSGPRRRAGELRAVLERAEDEGLPRTPYRLGDIDTRWQAAAPGEQACLELLLTAAFERYSRDLATGRLAPRQADPTWHIPPPVFDPAAALRALSPDGDLAGHLAGLAPAHDLYRRLRSGLARYRGVAERGGWDTALAGPTLEPGDEGARVAALRERLGREGDVEDEASGPGDRYDASLTAAVRRFQRRHGLADDGVVGPRTLAALDTPVQERVAQLARAMERVRWLPHDLGRHDVLVNTAAFELAVIEDQRTVLGMRVIVGTVNQATPSFAAVIRSLVINPYWNVPARIVRDRLLPRERENPGYLAARGFRVFDAATGRWRTPDARSLARTSGGAAPPRLRQEPGPVNLMGRLSFVLPNPFDVFLHDTPDRSLFAREARACSEGCVRLERAMALALHALREAPEWTRERIQDEIDALRHRVLSLPEPLAVYIVYLPTWVDEDGVAHFRPDHYGRERVLEREFPAAPGHQVRNGPESR